MNAEQVAEALKIGSERDLWTVLEIVKDREMWQWTRTVAESKGHDGTVRMADEELDKLPEITGLQALDAINQLAQRLTEGRWRYIRDAREQGATWEEIGATLGVTRQAAHEWYRTRIGKQEKLVPDYHDAARARAVLDE